MKSLICFLFLCSVANAQLAFNYTSLDTVVGGTSESEVFEDGALKDNDTLTSRIPSTGYGHTQGLISSGYNSTFAFWNNADGNHEAMVDDAIGWVLSSTITNDVYSAFIQAAWKQTLECNTSGTAPKVVRCDAYSMGWGNIARTYNITDPNKGSAQLVKITFTLKSVYSQTGLYSNHTDGYMQAHTGDNIIFAYATQNGWSVHRKLKTSSGAWEEPNGTHFIETTEGKNFEVSFVGYALVQGSFTSSAYYNSAFAGTPMEDYLTGSALINGVSGQNPNVTENLEPSIRVNIDQVTKAF